MSKKNLSLSLILCVTLTYNVSAKNLSAEQALYNSLQELTSMTYTNANIGDLKLVDSRVYNGERTLYIFSSPAMYVIASAKDNTPSLLAYSFESGFLSEPAISMEWWISQLSERIASCDNASIYYKTKNENRLPITPMLSTKWSQGEPFNNSCPLHNGERPATGCVATAIAQIMRFHSYPEKGRGNITWTCKRDSKSHVHYYDFESVTFDWENMRDVYDSGASQEEKNAVSELMHACGAASEMQYSPNASGSFIYLAAKGMIDYLQYDRGMEYLERNWFESPDEWDEICYQELSEGRPILYGGEDEVWHTRHAFVLDGYSEEGLYHINWGWEGKNDGYFRLTDFSYDGGNYRVNHAMVKGIKPGRESSEIVPAFSLLRKFTTNEAHYCKDSGAKIWFMEDIQNESLSDFWIIHGVKCVPTDGSPVFFVSGDKSWYRFRGVNRFYEIPAEDFPVGTYDVFPVFRSETGDWHPIYQNQNIRGYGVRFEVSETEIALQSAGVQAITTNNDEKSVFYNLSGIRVPAPDAGVYIKVTAGKAKVVKF